MSFPIKVIYLALFLAGTVGLQACSSQQKAEGEATPLDAGAGGTESGADAVGSIPEDMLADEGAAAETADASDPAASAVDGESKDPFTDLAEAEQSASEVSDSEQFAAISGTGNMKSYTVKAGDTLMKIAFSLYSDIDKWKDLREWNKDKLKNANHISKGMTLTYDEPSSTFQAEQASHTYEIKKGDTLAGIADEVYGRRSKFKKLQKFNAHLIKNPNRIFAGFTIFYDITEQEVAEAEARRQQRMAGGGQPIQQSAPTAQVEPQVEPQAVPSAIAPPLEAAPSAPKPVATAPASVAGHGASSKDEVLGPPSPGK